jgi:hypothetical protein
MSVLYINFAGLLQAREADRIKLWQSDSGSTQASLRLKTVKCRADVERKVRTADQAVSC